MPSMEFVFRRTTDGPTIGAAEACAAEAGSCKPKQNWDCIIDGVKVENKCDDASPQC